MLRPSLLCLVMVVALAIGALALGPPRALAHAQLLETRPAAGEVVPDSPAQITLRFNEGVSVPSDGVRIFAPDGSEVAGVALVPGERDVVTARPPSALGRGTHTVTWRVVSADGHPISGAFAFSVGVQTAAAPAVAPPSIPGWAENLFLAVKALDLALILLLAGGCLGLATFLGGAGAETLRAIRLALAVAALILLPVAGAAIYLESAKLAGSLGDGASATALGDILGATFGPPWVARMVLGAVLCGLLLWGARAPSGARRGIVVATAVAAAVLVVLPPLAGHARADGTIAVAVGALHVAGAAVWVGGLAVLGAALWRERGRRWDLAADAVPRFSAMALVAVAVLLGAGVVATFQRLGAWSDLLDSAFGRLVLIKAALLAVLVAIGALHRRAGVPALRARAAGAAARRRFGRLVGVELMLMVAAVGVTAVLASTSPPTSAASITAGGPVDVRNDVGPFATRIVVTPGTPGSNHIAIYVRDDAGELVSPDEVTASASLPARGVAEMPLTVRAWEPGHFSVADARLGLPGEWRLELTLRVGEFDAYSRAIPVVIGGPR